MIIGSSISSSLQRCNKIFISVNKVRHDLVKITIDEIIVDDVH